MKNVLKSIIAVGIISLSSPALALDLTSLEVSDRTVVAVDGDFENSVIFVAEEYSDDKAGNDVYAAEGPDSQEGVQEEAPQEEGNSEEVPQEEGNPEESPQEEGAPEEGAQEEAPEEGQKPE